MEPKQGESNLTWHKAIIEVLKSSNKAMRTTDIVDEIIQRGLRKDVGATPVATVGALIYSSRKREKEKSPFLKTAPGEFMLREKGGVDVADSKSIPEVAEQTEEETELKQSVGIIRAFGMYWQRELVEWQNLPQILGKQLEEADSVNFCNQKGVYLLHDGSDVIYAGRALERPLGRRLFEHTFDRLKGRWNRFSWFGLLQVTPDGKLIEPNFEKVTQKDIIITMEALLIEGLEPRQNRKRGDTDFRAIEYVQNADPNIKKRKMKELFEEFVSTTQLTK